MAKKINTKKQEEKNMAVENSQKHILKGRIVSVASPQTVTVLVEGKKTHPLYGKSYVSSKRYLAHTEHKLALGDVVELVKIRPISKSKHFKVVKVVGRDIEAVITEQLKEEAAEEIAEIMPEEKEEEEAAEAVKAEVVEKKPKRVRKEK